MAHKISLESRLGKPISTEAINTNNSWGFGGWNGTRTHYAGGYQHDKGQASTRHAGEFPVDRVRIGCAIIATKTFIKLWNSGVNTKAALEEKYKERYR